MRYLFKELGRHKWGTAFNIIGYTTASLFILIILSVTGTNKDDSFGILQNTGTHFIMYVPTDVNCCSSGIADGTIFAEGVKTMMLEDDLIRYVKDVEGVRDAAPCLLYRMYDVNFRTDISIGGIDTSSMATFSNVCARTNLIEGRYFTDNPDELVVEESFASGHNLSPGDTLYIFGGKMIISGIVNSGIKPVKADFYAPIEVVRTLLKEKLQCIAPGFDMNIILVEVSDPRLQDDVINHVKNMAYKFSVSTYSCYEPANRVMSIIERSSLGLTVIIFIFLVVFSAKTQLGILMERLREIGILKSMGWADTRLGGNIILSSFIQAFAGVTLGIILWILLVSILKSQENSLIENLDFRLLYRSLPVLYGLSLGGALIAGIFPILRIFRTKAGDIINNNL